MSEKIWDAQMAILPLRETVPHTRHSASVRVKLDRDMYYRDAFGSSVFLPAGTHEVSSTNAEVAAFLEWLESQ